MHTKQHETRHAQSHEMDRLVRPIVVAMAAACLTIGCQPQPDPEELGTVLHKLPRVPGAESPYPLPELDEN